MVSCWLLVVSGPSTFDWRVDKRLAHKRKRRRKMKSKIWKRTKSKSRSRR